MPRDPEQIWKRIVAQLQEAPVELRTVPSNKREPLWFCVVGKNGDLDQVHKCV